MSDTDNEKIGFTIEPEEEAPAVTTVEYAIAGEEEAPAVTTVEYAIAGEEESKGAAEAAENADAVAPVDGESATECVKEETSQKQDGIVTIPACLVAKDFKKEYVYIALLSALCVGGVLIAVLVAAYLFAGIVIAVLGALAAMALVNHIADCKKVTRLVASGECKTITELMAKMGKKRSKPEFVRTVGGMIRDGHLVGYAVLDDEVFVKKEREGNAQP